MKRVLITGGTGTLGQEVVKQLLAKNDIETIVILSRDELRQTSLKWAVAQEHRSRLVYVLGSITDRESVWRSIHANRVDTVLHTAAAKHVPICEMNPTEAFRTNIEGSQIVLQAAVESDTVRSVTLVGTDKAAEPANVYGFTKALMERLIPEYDGINETRVNAVRFGNLLGSKGSVLELFQKQIKEKGTVTATDPEMTRFWISVRDSAEFAIRAMTGGAGNCVFVPSMPMATLGDLITAAFANYGLDTQMKLIGSRPGEKKHEYIIGPDEVIRTELGLFPDTLWSRFHGWTIHTRPGFSVDPAFRIEKAVASCDAPRFGSEELRDMIAATPVLA